MNSISRTSQFHRPIPTGMPVVAKTPALPRSVVDAAMVDFEWTPHRALKEISHLARDIARYAREAADAASPCPTGWLEERLTALQMMMTSGWSEAKALIWLEEMSRLLADIPQDILSAAIDETVKASRFLPTVAEIRAHADPQLSKRRKMARRLGAMADAAACERPAWGKDGFDLTTRCTPEEAATIMDEFGLRSETQRTRAAHRGPPRAPTAAETAEIMREMGLRAS